MKGKFHIYTGNGKGKTTAAMGLAVRAAGAGFKVFIGQFIKSGNYSEVKTLNKIDNIVVKQYGTGRFIRNEAEEIDIELARKGLVELKEILRSEEYQLVIMDEANIAVYYKLFSLAELIKAIEERAENVEVVVTGRMAAEQLIEKADLVSRVEEVKHYYRQGVVARTGIEK
jgi:cob(I)alamin adenosyltransferase